MLKPSAAGFRARVYAIEWHGNLWRTYGTPLEQCVAMIQHCTECVEADFYGAPRPQTSDPHIARMQDYFDALFSKPSSDFPGVSFA